MCAHFPERRGHICISQMLAKNEEEAGITEIFEEKWASSFSLKYSSLDAKIDGKTCLTAAHDRKGLALVAYEVFLCVIIIIRLLTITIHFNNTLTL
jgi:hypothetical protein